MEWAALTLALAALVLGLTAVHPLSVAVVGAPVSGPLLTEL